MKNFMILTESLQFIEQNLCEPITREGIAKHCHVSLSMLEKLYGYALHIGIKDYISKRRMTQAAKDIFRAEENITEIAMKYQYNSVEVFSRTFRRVWNVNPSQFTENWRFTGIFPKINYEYKEGEDLYMARKKVDFSEAYDYLKSLKGSYVLCFDCQNLIKFNHISHKAGDLAILEMASRIDKAAGDDMLPIRIGGDEFALITGLYDYDQAKALSEEVLAKNGEPIQFEDQSIPLSLWCGIMKIPESLRYNELFRDMQETIMKSKALADS